MINVISLLFFWYLLFFSWFYPIKHNLAPHLHSVLSPAFIGLPQLASLVSILCGYIPSPLLFSLIKENAIQLSFFWPIASLFSLIILLFINTTRLPIRHTAHVISRDGRGSTCDNDVAACISFLQRGTSMDSFMFSLHDYKGLACSDSRLFSCLSVSRVLDIGRRSMAGGKEANAVQLKAHSKFTLPSGGQSCVEEGRIEDKFGSQLSQSLSPSVTSLQPFYFLLSFWALLKVSLH